MSTALAPSPSGALLRPMTPKEFSAAIGGLRSPEWVRDQCAAGLLRLVRKGRPYLIHPTALAQFRPTLEELRFLVVR